MGNRVRIGTSGWNYKHWLGRFYPRDLPQKDLLSFYAERFDTVEVNNSFYQLPKITTMSSWRNTVPDGFLFAIKASRFITHMKKLKSSKTSSEKFFHRTDRLQEKLGPILFQLPPRWRRDAERLAGFLEALPAPCRYAFEFRDPSWLHPEIYEVLRKHNAAFCIHDFRDQQIPREITADFTYVRMHGPSAAAYSGSYPLKELAAWADQIGEWCGRLKQIYVYFNNDIDGHAITNALKLRELCERTVRYVGPQRQLSR